MTTKLEEDPVRWFDSLGSCEMCGKPANGKLKGARNDNYGSYCTSCANKRLKKADEIRAALKKQNGSST